MTLDEYQSKVCESSQKPAYWGTLTIDLCAAACKASGIWSDILNCPLSMTDAQMRQLNRKFADEIGKVLRILAILTHEAGIPLSTVYKYAHHSGMGDAGVTKYVLRLVGSTGDFLCPSMVGTDLDFKRLIENNSVFIMHDALNVIAALTMFSIDDIITNDLIRMQKRKKGKP